MEMFWIIALALLMLAVGGLLGWIVRGYGAAALLAERDQNFKRSISDLGLAVKERDEARIRLSALEAEQNAREAGFEERLIELREAKDALSAQFSEIGGKLYEKAQQAFLERADERFKQSEAISGQNLKLLLQPVETTLKRYEEGLKAVEAERVGSYGELKTAISLLSQGNADVRRETQRLANVMRSSPKARGRWGEEQLRTVLESAGLAQNVDFNLQSTVTDGDQQLRPDCIIGLPGGRTIVVDVKCPLVAFEQAFDEEDETRRADLLLQHASAMRSYANELGKKAYWRQFEQSPDFVIMFIPGEHFLSAAAERAPELITDAFKNGVIIASTINMLALAKLMAGMWRQEKLSGEAREIAKAGKDLFASLSKLSSHVTKLGRNLGQAAGAYNDMIGSLDSNVYSKAQKLEALSVDTQGKPIEDIQPIDIAIRSSVKLTGNSDSGAALIDSTESDRLR